jgi:NAD(P)-dependent dehydrogenase (short-subunit alcohol dehydrogenase family)
VRTCNSEGVSDRVGNDSLQGYRHMIEGCPIGRAGTSNEVANAAALLMGPDGAFITGSDFLIDGGVAADYYW